MDEKYLNKYYELSKALKQTNKSQKTIEKVYDFIKELGKGRK